MGHCYSGALLFEVVSNEPIMNLWFLKDDGTQLQKSLHFVLDSLASCLNMFGFSFGVSFSSCPRLTKICIALFQWRQVVACSVTSFVAIVRTSLHLGFV